MTAPKNQTNALIAYGSRAPGGANHSIYAGLPGKWRKGFIHQTCHAAPDDVGPGERDLVEAWLLEMPSRRAGMFTPAYAAQARKLHELWCGLDAAIGPAWARTEMRWWPEGAKPVAAKGGMRVANVHVPLERFTYLADRDDVPHPDDADDLEKLWDQVRRGEKKYDWGLFIALIKDAHPDRLDALFGDLPGASEFMARLKRLFADHGLHEGSLLAAGDGRFYGYVCPLQRNALPMKELLALAQADIAQRAAFLRRHGEDEDAAVLEQLRFEAGDPEDTDDEAAGGAMEVFDDVLHEDEDDRPRWMQCLNEACYGIAASFVLQNWLMLGFRAQQDGLDLEPAYRLWKAGGECVFDGGTCFVREVARREA